MFPLRLFFSRFRQSRLNCPVCKLIIIWIIFHLRSNLNLVLQSVFLFLSFNLLWFLILLLLNQMFFSHQVHSCFLFINNFILLYLLCYLAQLRLFLGNVLFKHHLAICHDIVTLGWEIRLVYLIRLYFYQGVYFVLKLKKVYHIIV